MMVLFSMATMRGPFTGTVMTVWPRAEVYTRTPWQDVTATSFIGKAGAKPLAFLNPLPTLPESSANDRGKAAGAAGTA